MAPHRAYRQFLGQEALIQQPRLRRLRSLVLVWGRHRIRSWDSCYPHWSSGVGAHLSEKEDGYGGSRWYACVSRD
jgi:hypothetical protein